MATGQSSETPRICPRCEKLSDVFQSGYCPPCRKAYNREWFLKNQTRQREKQREYYHANRDEERAKRNAKNRLVKQETIDAYGGKCACCGETQLEFLAIDHINGGGKQHRKEAVGSSAGAGARFYRWLRRQGYPQGHLRVLCHNCNQAMGFLGYCPHGNLEPASYARVKRPDQPTTETK